LPLPPQVLQFACDVGCLREGVDGAYRGCLRCCVGEGAEVWEGTAAEGGLRRGRRSCTLERRTPRCNSWRRR
jgi:hypothetical protein